MSFRFISSLHLFLSFHHLPWFLFVSLPLIFLVTTPFDLFTSSSLFTSCLPLLFTFSFSPPPHSPPFLLTSSLLPSLPPPPSFPSPPHSLVSFLSTSSVAALPSHFLASFLSFPAGGTGKHARLTCLPLPTPAAPRTCCRHGMRERVSQGERERDCEGGSR